MIFCRFFLVYIYNYNNRSSSIICSFFSEGMIISLGIFVVELGSDFFGFFRFFKVASVIFSAIFFPTNSSVVSTVFWIALFEVVLRASVVNFFVVSRSFYSYLLLRFLLTFFAKGKYPWSLK